MADPITNRSWARPRMLAVIGALSVLLAQFVVWAGPAPAQVAPPVLYAADGAGGNPATTLYTVNPATGATDQTIGPIGFSVTGLAFDPTTGILYGSTTSSDANEPGSLITINKQTGAGALVGAPGTTIIPGCDTGTADLTFTTDGTLYGWTECFDMLVQINKSTGVGLNFGPGEGSSGSGLDADPDDNTLWLTPDDDDGPYGTVDRMTGVFTDQGTLDGDNNASINSLAWSCDGETLYGTANIDFGAPSPREFITIDTATDHVTVLGGPAGIDEEQDALAWDCGITQPPVVCKGQPATLAGTSGNDVLTGTASKDVVAGLSGNDRISAQGGNDVVCAGGGNDRANGGGGKDRLLGQGGNDKLKGAGGNDRLQGGGGRDNCNGGPGRDKGSCEKEKSIP
jgi:Ca2+-binding RTX toxin-like protein